MNSSPYVSALAEQLANQGLPVAYITRVVEELGDHCADRSGDSTSDLESSIGKVSTLVGQFVTAYRSRSFAGRHPWLAVFLLPILATPLAVVGYYSLLVFSTLSISARLGIPFPEGTLSDSDNGPLILGVVTALHSLGMILPMAVTMWWSARAAIAAGRGYRWLAVGCVVQCTLAAACISHLSLPLSGTEHAALSVSFLPLHDWEQPVHWATQIGNGLILALLAMFFWSRTFTTSSRTFVNASLVNRNLMSSNGVAHD